MHPTRSLARLVAVALLFLSTMACTPALTEGAATAGDAAAKLWLAGRGITACSAAPPAPPSLPPASVEPSVDQLLGAMAYGATLAHQADAVKDSAAELQRIAAELLAERAKAALQPHHETAESKAELVPVTVPAPSSGPITNEAPAVPQ